MDLIQKWYKQQINQYTKHSDNNNSVFTCDPSIQPLVAFIVATMKQQPKSSFLKSHSSTSSTSEHYNCSQSPKLQRMSAIVRQIILNAINQLKHDQLVQSTRFSNPTITESSSSDMSYSNNNIDGERTSLIPSLSYIKRISLNLQQSRTQQILQQLRKGYLVKKHSPNTSQPHDKFIYISEDHRFFCWKSIDKNDEKSLELRKIAHVVKGIQWAKSKSMQRIKGERAKNCLVMVSEVRSLQLQMFNSEVVDVLYDGFLEVMKNSKRMHLSYQF